LHAVHDLLAVLEAWSSDDPDADVDGDGIVGVEDMLACIAGWGSPDGDADGDGTTGVSDILLIISAWGESCP